LGAGDGGMDKEPLPADASESAVVAAVAEPPVMEEEWEEARQVMGVEGALLETAGGTVIVQPAAALTAGEAARASFESTVVHNVDVEGWLQLGQQGSSSSSSGVLQGLQEQLSVGLSPFASAIRAITGVSLWGRGQRVQGGVTEAEVRAQLEELKRKREARRAEAEGLNATVAGLNSQMSDLQAILHGNQQAVTEQKRILTRMEALLLEAQVMQAQYLSSTETDQS
ncbi:hypothetical protein CLOM_g13801, partial [Closterium sp. NIES-68]